MIKEDYVSFETAKLLKEKGFDEPCYQYYLTTKTLHTTFHNRVHIEEEPVFNSSGLSGLYEVSNKTLFEDICSAPTLQMAMKWLREVHNLDIIATPQFDNSKWTYSAMIFKLSIPYTQIRLNDNKDKKEAAFEDAIKYCLKNLI